MTHRLKSTILCIGIGISCLAGPLDQMSAAKLAVRHLDRPLLSRSSGEYTPLLIEVLSDNSLDKIKSYGTVIFGHRDDIIACCVPDEHLSDVLKLNDVVSASLSHSICTCLDMGRSYGNIDAIHSGIDLPHSIDGTGVVVGMSDIGFCPDHPSFDGRIAELHYYNEYSAIEDAVTDPTITGSYTTDNDQEMHASHVANIMAGGYHGNGYYGVAPGASIIATTSHLTDVGIVAGIEDVIAYAKSHNMPAVVNLSLASFNGPHDGSDLMCRYLDSCGEDAVICISAGNMGNRTISADHTFTAGAPSANVRISDCRKWDGMDVYGATDIWSADDRKFSVRIKVYDGNTKSIVYTSQWVGGDGFDGSLIIHDKVDAEWSKYLSGYISIEAGLNETNGRYNIALLYHTKSSTYSDAGNWTRYYTVVEVGNAAENTRIDMYADGSNSYFKSVDRLPNAHISADGSVSNMATGRNVLCVGSFVSRNSAPAIEGDDFTWERTVGGVSNFSSYGTTINGDVLPHVCAPGDYIVSASNTAYIDGKTDSEITAAAEINGKKYYWVPMCGTSMSSPFVAGVAALWLQADPSLSPEDIRRIALETADAPRVNPTDPRWGGGAINAMAGLRKILGLDGLRNLSIIKPVISVGADRRIIISGAEATDARLYTIEGLETSICAPLEQGIYIISINGDSYKIAVR